MIIILLAAAFLPAILLWFYIWKKDTQKEPHSMVNSKHIMRFNYIFNI